MKRLREKQKLAKLRGRVSVWQHIVRQKRRTSLKLKLSKPVLRGSKRNEKKREGAVEKRTEKKADKCTSKQISGKKKTARKSGRTRTGTGSRMCHAHLALRLLPGQLKKEQRTRSLPL